MTVKTPYSIEDIVYLKLDTQQEPYHVVGIIVRRNSVQLEIDRLGDILEVYDFQVSKTKDELIGLGIDKNDD